MSYIGNTAQNINYVPAVDYFNGDGSTVAFTLSRPVASVAAVQAVISNVPQNPGSAFTVSGSTITFTSAPPSGTANIYVYYTSPNTQIVQPGQGTVQPSSLSTGGPSWDSNGDLGVGTTNASERITVDNGASGNTFVRFDANGTFQGLIGVSQNAGQGSSSAVAGDNIVRSQTRVLLDTAGTTRMLVDSSGNVGIGTSSPAGKLDVRPSSASGMTVGLDGANTYVNYRANNVDAVVQLYAAESSGGGFFAVGTKSTGGVLSERMRINSGGIVSVGTTATDNPSGGFVLYVENQNSQLMIGHENGAPTGRAYAKFCYNSGSIGTITQNGTTAVAYNTTSDYRLKDNVQPMTGALEKVAQLNPVTYTWKADGSDGQGFIAHELQAVVPDCVTGEKDAVDEEGKPVYQGIDTSFLVATLTAAIQELNAKVEAQAAEIAALKGQA